MEGSCFYGGYFSLEKRVHNQSPLMVCAKAHAVQHIYRQSGKGEIVKWQHLLMILNYF